MKMFHLSVVLGLDDGGSGGVGEGFGGAGGGGCKLQQRHILLYEDNEVISRAWKCLLHYQISMFAGPVEQEGSGKKKWGSGGEVHEV